MDPASAQQYSNTTSTTTNTTSGSDNIIDTAHHAKDRLAGLHAIENAVDALTDEGDKQAIKAVIEQRKQDATNAVSPQQIDALIGDLTQLKQELSGGSSVESPAPAPIQNSPSKIGMVVEELSPPAASMTPPVPEQTQANVPFTSAQAEMLANGASVGLQSTLNTPQVTTPPAGQGQDPIDQLMSKPLENPDGKTSIKDVVVANLQNQDINPVILANVPDAIEKILATKGVTSMPAGTTSMADMFRDNPEIYVEIKNALQAKDDEAIQSTLITLQKLVSPQPQQSPPPQAM